MRSAIVVWLIATCVILGLSFAFLHFYLRPPGEDHFDRFLGRIQLPAFGYAETSSSSNPQNEKESPGSHPQPLTHLYKEAVHIVRKRDYFSDKIGGNIKWNQEFAARYERERKKLKNNNNGPRPPWAPRSTWPFGSRSPSPEPPRHYETAHPYMLSQPDPYFPYYQYLHQYPVNRGNMSKQRDRSAQDFGWQQHVVVNANGQPVYVRQQGRGIDPRTGWPVVADVAAGDKTAAERHFGDPRASNATAYQYPYQQGGYPAPVPTNVPSQGYTPIRPCPRSDQPPGFPSTWQKEVLQSYAARNCIDPGEQITFAVGGRITDEFHRLELIKDKAIEDKLNFLAAEQKKREDAARLAEEERARTQADLEQSTAAAAEAALDAKRRLPDKMEREAAQGHLRNMAYGPQPQGSQGPHPWQQHPFGWGAPPPSNQHNQYGRDFEGDYKFGQSREYPEHQHDDEHEAYDRFGDYTQ